MIVIVDYGMGNLGSVKNMLKKVRADFKLSDSVADIRRADKLILPGVGAFDQGMKNLSNLGYKDEIIEAVKVNRKPILGICLGMQLLTKGSEEGDEDGFGFIDAYAHKITSDGNDKIKVPHMGWNVAKPQKSSVLLDVELLGELRYYFVHSYAILCENQEDILSTSSYHKQFVSSFERENIVGAQFHPEKSHKFGMSFFSRFASDF